ncbi:unnamed protein product [Ilex paraguariensis]
MISLSADDKFIQAGLNSSRTVLGRNACEIQMVHQEDAGLNVEIAKLAFAKGIWSYVCKMDHALRKYSAFYHLRPIIAVNAISLIQKVPPELDTINISSADHPETSTASAICCKVACERSRKKLLRPSNKLIANGLIFLGGVICLSRGQSNLGAKVAMAYILSKLTKRGASSSQSRQALVP